MVWSADLDFKYSGREQWQAMGGKGDFATWMMRQIIKFGLVEGTDFTAKMVKSALGRPRIDYMLCEGSLRKIQLGYGKSKHIVQAAVAEKSVEIDELLNNPRRLAQIFLDYADTKDKLELLHHSDCMLTMQEIAKDLGYESAWTLNEILVQKGYMYRDDHGRALPRANKIPKECYAIKGRVGNTGKVFNCLKWTMRGKEWIARVMTLNSMRLK